MSIDRTKLGKVLALLASDQPGEVAAAAARATAMLRAADTSFDQILVGGPDHDCRTYSQGYAAGLTAGARSHIGTMQEAYRTGKAEGRREAMAEHRRRFTGHERFQAGYDEGVREGGAEAERRFAGADAYRQGHADGYRAGHDAAQPSVIAAYSRGLADGKAGVDLGKPKQRRRA